jgi:triosephosphate isomerase
VQYRRWVERSGAAFPFIYGDVTILETISRANPGMLLLKNGTIYWKKNLMDIDFDELDSDRLENQSLGQMVVIDGWTRFYWMIALLVVPYLLLLLLRVVQSWQVKRTSQIK